jgi:hypothetical protein
MEMAAPSAFNVQLAANMHENGHLASTPDHASGNETYPYAQRQHALLVSVAREEPPTAPD